MYNLHFEHCLAALQFMARLGRLLALRGMLQRCCVRVCACVCVFLPLSLPLFFCRSLRPCVSGAGRCGHPRSPVRARLGRLLALRGMVRFIIFMYQHTWQYMTLGRCSWGVCWPCGAW